MFTKVSSLALLATFAAACAGQAHEELALNTDFAAQASHVQSFSAELQKVDGLRSQNQEVATTRVFTSADQYEAYFGNEAPAEVDFESEWLVYAAMGMRNSGGYSIAIESVDVYPNHGGIVVRTKSQAPGADCLVTLAITSPYTMVKMDIPENIQWYYPTGDHEVYSCALPNAEERAQVEESFVKWLDLKDENNDSYTYSSSFASFFNFFFRTDFVVKNGKVVERSLFLNGALVPSWVEKGADVGTNDGAHEPATIDDLYVTCLDKVLVQDPEDNFIDVSFDDDGILRSCTFFPKACADDCSQGVDNISNLTFKTFPLDLVILDGPLPDKSDDFFLGDVSIEGNILSAEVSYSGGCQSHSFEAMWDGLILETFPPQVRIKLRHDGNGDQCEAFITETIEVDLSPALGAAGDKVIVRVQGVADSKTVLVD